MYHARPTESATYDENETKPHGIHICKCHNTGKVSFFAQIEMSLGYTAGKEKERKLLAPS